MVQLADGGWAIYGHAEPGVPQTSTYAPEGGLESALPAFVAERRLARKRFQLARPSDPIKAPARAPRGALSAADLLNLKI